MSDPDVDGRIRWIIVKQLGISEDLVVPEAKFFEDLGADSLDIVLLLMAVEEAFSLVVPREYAQMMRTVGDVAKYVDGHKISNG